MNLVKVDVTRIYHVCSWLIISSTGEPRTRKQNTPRYEYQIVPGTRRGGSFGKWNTYRKKMAYRTVSWNADASVEAMRCINEWATGRGDANDMAWKDRCIHSWLNESMNEWSHESLSQSVSETKHWINESNDESINPWIKESMNQWSSQEMNQGITEWVK